MIILHGAILGREFYLWGETSEAVPAVAKRGRKAKAPAATALPFSAGAQVLAAALRDRFPGLEVSTPEATSLSAWLPAAGTQPVASSPLIAPPPEPGVALSMGAWTVTALRLAPAGLIELLGACLLQETLAPGLVAGKDLNFWAQALRLASALATRQQFLPGLAKMKDQWRAGWEAVFIGADAERLAKLARAMPPVCRGISTQANVPPTTPAADVLKDFIHLVVDHLVRSSNLPATGMALQSRARFDSLHDQWLAALRSPEGIMSGEEKELAQLASQIADWRRPISVTAAAPVKLCFRLEEPITPPEQGAPAEPGSEPASVTDVTPPTPATTPNRPEITPSTQPWHVRFLLQPADDPSLLVEAGEVWKKRSSQAALLRRGEFQPREYLLSALGQAAGICPRLEASLKTTAPAGYELDAAGAHEFLTQRAGALEQAGFGVLLPAWWTGRGTKLRLSVRAKVKSPAMQGGSGLSLEEIVKFDWEIALGDITLTLAELQALAKLKAPLVKIRGQWVQLNAEEIQAAIDLWRKQASGQVEARVRDLVQMALGAKPAADGLQFEGVRAEGWIAELLDQLEGRAAFEELPQPEQFRGQLRPYQKRGFSWLAFLRRWGLGACLADDMGLGKTIQVLALIEKDWQATQPGPVLLICPTSVTGNWQKEAARFTPTLPVLVHHGTERTKGAAFRALALQQALVISSYSLLHRDFNLFKEVPWSGIILDEAQNIKNPETKQSKAARSLSASCRIALTGTPVENNVGDLWSIMEFLNPGFLGKQSEFKSRFFLPIQVDHDPRAATRLKRLTGPFILRRLKTDKTIISDLPEKLEMKVFCPLTKEQASLYAAVVEEAGDAIEDSEGIQRRGLVLATLLKLKQVCNHPAHFLGDNSAIPNRSGKLARLTEMLEEVLAANDRALIFSQFTEMGELLRRHLQETFGREVLFLHGGVVKKQRDRMVERFQQEHDAPPIFLLSLKAGGTGLNLTRANHVFHFDRWWNPAVENQATDRAFRIGQTRNVQVHKFLCQGTLEEKIDEMIERKKEIAANVVGAGEAWLTELSTAELKELFALRAEAVQE